MLNVLYEVRFVVFGGMCGYSWSLVDGILFGGFMFDVSGILSGALSEEGFWRIMVVVSDGALSVFCSYCFFVSMEMCLLEIVSWFLVFVFVGY